LRRRLLPRPTLFPYTTLFRSAGRLPRLEIIGERAAHDHVAHGVLVAEDRDDGLELVLGEAVGLADRLDLRVEFLRVHRPSSVPMMAGVRAFRVDGSWQIDLQL